MATIHEPERHAVTGGVGLSYKLGTKLCNVPLAMHATAANQINDAIRQRLFDGAGQINVTPSASRWIGTEAGRSRYRVTDDGIAIVPIGGVLIDRGDWLGDLYGMATTYEGLAEQFRRIGKDSAIKSVILDEDSPGGMVAGLFELADDELRALKKLKKVYAIAQNDACSAAYAICANAHEAYITRTGRMGSIGVIVLHQSYQRMMDGAGVDTTIIQSGDYKSNGNPYQQLSHLARSEMAAGVDEAMTAFVRHVAKARGISEDSIRSMQARTYTGEKAVEAGLADGVMSIDDLLQHIRKGKAPSPKKAARTERAHAASPTTTGARAMPNSNEAAEAPNYPDYNAIIAASLSTIAATLPRGAELATAQQRTTTPVAVAAPAVAAAPVTVAASTTVDQKARFKAIMGCDAAKTRGGLAQHLALETDLDAEQAAKILGAAPEEGKASGKADATNNAFLAQMAKPGSSAGVKPEAGTGGGHKPQSLADYTTQRVTKTARKGA